MSQLIDKDKERCRYHLGYLGTSFAASIVMGVPTPLQTSFLIEDAMNRLNGPEVVTRVQALLCTLDNLETQMIKAAGMLGIETAGELTLHPLRGTGKLVTDSLEAEYYRWGCRLADVLGVPPYPFSRRYQRRGPGTNVPVG
jgi:hypothetical protein